MNVVVSDTSPIRALAQLELLELPSRLYETILIPPAVATELAIVVPGLPKFDPTTIPGAQVRRPVDQAHVRDLGEQLGPGEAEAIVLAIEWRATAVLIDESDGRRVALRLGLRPLGVLGLLAQARNSKLVGPLMPLIQRLQHEIAFRVSPDVIERVLRLGGDLKQ